MTPGLLDVERPRRSDPLACWVIGVLAAAVWLFVLIQVAR